MYEMSGGSIEDIRERVNEQDKDTEDIKEVPPKIKKAMDQTNIKWDYKSVSGYVIMPKYASPGTKDLNFSVKGMYKNQQLELNITRGPMGSWYKIRDPKASSNAKNLVKVKNLKAFVEETNKQFP